jgi:hypothetical protein
MDWFAVAKIEPSLTHQPGRGVSTCVSGTHSGPRTLRSRTVNSRQDARLIFAPATKPANADGDVAAPALPGARVKMARCYCASRSCSRCLCTTSQEARSLTSVVRESALSSRPQPRTCKSPSPHSCCTPTSEQPKRTSDKEVVGSASSGPQLRSTPTCASDHGRQTRHQSTGGATVKRLLIDGGPFGDLGRCTRTTVAALHNRMPVIIDPDDCDAWLTAAGTTKPHALLQPFPAQLMWAVPVSKRRNSVENDDPAPIENNDSVRRSVAGTAERNNSCRVCVSGFDQPDAVGDALCATAMGGASICGRRASSSEYVRYC